VVGDAADVFAEDALGVAATQGGGHKGRSYRMMTVGSGELKTSCLESRRRG